MGKLESGQWTAWLKKNTPVLLVLLLGVVLMLLPGRQSTERRAASSVGAAPDTEEEKLAQLLEDISGVGEATVLLRRDGGEYLGAVVVCRGAESAAVRLTVQRAVGAYTGLGSDRIVILKMQE